MTLLAALALLAQEGVRELAEAQQQSGGVESFIVRAVGWLRLAVETTGAVIITIGVFLAVIQFLRALARPLPNNFNSIRLTLARYLALALEFQLGADILSTAIAPSWTQIGKLGAIAVIRTGLNYFLMREMREERGQPNATGTSADAPAAPRL